VSRFALFVNTLAALAVASAVVGALLLVLLALPGTRRRVRRAAAGRVQPILGIAWLTAVVATAGSLYLSEGAGLVPCILCWYQRIAMYPLALVLLVGYLRADAETWRFALPLSLVGLAISVYHVALQYQPALDVVSCSAEAPCTMRYFAAYGFVSIPVMAGAGFLFVSALLLTVRSATGWTPVVDEAPLGDAGSGAGFGDTGESGDGS